MIDITFLTSSQVALRNALVNRGIIEQRDGEYVGVLPGVEVTWNTVPNPIVSVLGDPSANPPVAPTYDSRKVYMLRLAHEADADDDDGSATEPDDPDPRLSRSKIRKWIIANSVNDPITGADGTVYRTRKVSASIWVVYPQDAPAFGVWQ